MKHRGWIAAVSLAFVLVITVHVGEGSPNEPMILQAGDYGVYSIGDCDPGGAWFYPPFFGFPDAENASDQIAILAEVCSVQLRWDVLAVTGGTATVGLQMSGWGRESFPGAFLTVFNESWHPDKKDPVYVRILEILHAKHTLRVDLDSMDVTEDGRYIGRWTFHVTPEEVATGRAEIVRNWFGETLVSVPLRVTKSIDAGDAANLKVTYGLDTFVDINGGGGPMPEGFGTYVVGGWGQRQQTIPVAGRYHDPTTSLLLVSYSWHYDDLLFNLGGLIMLTDWAAFPGGFRGHFSFMHLVETNIFQFPEPDLGGSSEGGSGDDGGGDAGGDTGQGSEDEGGGAQDETGGEAPSAEPPSLPWSTVFFFAAVAVLTVVIAYLRLRPPGGKGDGGP